MMMKQFSKFLIFAIGLLSSNLLNTFITKYMLNWLNVKTNAYYSTIIGMISLMAIYFPLFGLSEKIVNYLTAWYFKNTTVLSKNKIQSFFIGFIIIFALLYVGYLWVWYKKTIW